MDSTGAANERENRLRTLYEAVHDDLLRFVTRRSQVGAAGGAGWKCGVCLVERRARATFLRCGDQGDQCLSFFARPRRPRRPGVMSGGRGGWVFVLVDGPRGEGACLTTQGLAALKSGSARGDGFFGRFDPAPPDKPALAADRIEETESMAGAVSRSGRLPFSSVDAWFAWVKGYVGSDVTPRE